MKERGEHQRADPLIEYLPIVAYFFSLANVNLLPRTVSSIFPS